jgi:hypothetical protein
MKIQSSRRACVEPLEVRCHLSGTGSTTLLLDNFSGTALNTAIWQQAIYDPKGSTYVPRTQFQVLDSSPSPTVKGGELRPNLQSYNPTQLPGKPSFWGTEILSKQGFSVTPGKTIEVRIRAKLNAMPGGGVLGLFLYEAQSTKKHDEIDTELESNQIASGTNEVETNAYADAPTNSTGSPQSYAFPAGGALTGWHTYEMKLNGGVSENGVTLIAPSVSWYVDGDLVRTEESTIPTHAMNLYINFWAPDQTWPQAYNADIQPTTKEDQNQIWTADVDSASVTSLTDAVPFAISSATIKMAARDILVDQPESATGKVLGSGSGNIRYRWFIEQPNGTVAEASSLLVAKMTDGDASIPRISGLASSDAGTYRAWIQIIEPNFSRLNSAVRSYQVSGAAPGDVRGR